MKPRPDDPLSCPEARAAIQVRLDEPLPADRETALHRHLSECKACSAYKADLGAIRNALQSMPLFELPADVRKDVRSVLAGRDTRLEWFTRGFAGRRRRTAIAAVLVLAVCGTWWAIRSPGPHYSDAEVARAAEDLELALALAAGAMDEVERITYEDVLAQWVLPAMRQMPVRWPTSRETSYEKGHETDDR